VEELNHRVRNMLTVVSAISQQTLARSRNPEEFTRTLQGRIQALAKAYGLLSREQWGDVPVREVLLNELAQYRDESDGRIVVDGPPVALKPAAALALGLMVHELATNATKYGALSRVEGRVAVKWIIEGSSPRKLTLKWGETGGPPVKKPKHKGFGTELIQREVTGTLGGEVSFDYASAGFQARMSVPLDGSVVSSGWTDS